MSSPELGLRAVPEALSVVVAAGRDDDVGSPWKREGISWFLFIGTGLSCLGMVMVFGTLPTALPCENNKLRIIPEILSGLESLCLPELLCTTFCFCLAPDTEKKHTKTRQDKIAPFSRPNEGTRTSAFEAASIDRLRRCAYK